MNNNKIGDLGEAKVLAKFVEMGCDVYIPFSGHSAVDMIIDTGNKLLKIQVKSSTYTENGCTKFHTTKINRRDYNQSYAKVKYSTEEIDYFALYSVQADEVYLIPIDECNGSSFWIRHDMNVKKCATINKASDYLFENVIEQIVN